MMPDRDPPFDELRDAESALPQAPRSGVTGAVVRGRVVAQRRRRRAIVGGLGLVALATGAALLAPRPAPPVAPEAETPVVRGPDRTEVTHSDPALLAELDRQLDRLVKLAAPPPRAGLAPPDPRLLLDELAERGAERGLAEGLLLAERGDRAEAAIAWRRTLELYPERRAAADAARRLAASDDSTSSRVPLPHSDRRES